MQQEVVIKVSTSDHAFRFFCFRPRRSHSKALELAAGFSGVQSAALVGDYKDQIKVAGESLDVVKLATLLRKKVGPAKIVTVSSKGKKESGSKDKAAQQPILWPYVGGVPHREIAYVGDPYQHYSEPSCSIL